MSERVTTARVRELRDAATPGPWEHEHIGYGGQGVTMDARHSVFVDGRGNAALIAAAPDLAADLLEAREELRLTTPAVDAVRGVIAALCLAPDATYTEVVAAVEERAGMLAHAVQSWKARASGMEAAEREIARLQAIVDFWQRQHGVAVLVRDGDIAAWKGEAARLRAIVEGRTAPPTDAEMREHMDGGGAWLVTIPARRQVRLHPETRYVDEARAASLLWWTEGARWVAVLDGRPCAWPAPREPAADVARDAPGVCPRCQGGGVTAWIETMPPKPVLCDCPAGAAARVNPPEYVP